MAVRYLPLAILLLILPCSAGLIEDKEWYIKTATVEHAYVFSDRALVYYTQGNATSFWIPDLSILDNKILLHNHPPWCGEGPSAQDMRLAKAGNVKTMLVVTHNGIWETTRPFENYTFTAWPR